MQRRGEGGAEGTEAISTGPALGAVPRVNQSTPAIHYRLSSKHNNKERERGYNIWINEDARRQF